MMRIWTLFVVGLSILNTIWSYFTMETRTKYISLVEGYPTFFNVFYWSWLVLVYFAFGLIKDRKVTTPKICRESVVSGVLLSVLNHVYTPSHSYGSVGSLLSVTVTVTFIVMYIASGGERSFLLPILLYVLYSSPEWRFYLEFDTLGTIEMISKAIGYGVVYSVLSRHCMTILPYDVSPILMGTTSVATFSSLFGLLIEASESNLTEKYSKLPDYINGLSPSDDVFLASRHLTSSLFLYTTVCLLVSQGPMKTMVVLIAGNMIWCTQQHIESELPYSYIYISIGISALFILIYTLKIFDSRSYLFSELESAPEIEGDYRSLPPSYEEVA